MLVVDTATLTQSIVQVLYSFLKFIDLHQKNMEKLENLITEAGIFYENVYPC